MRWNIVVPVKNLPEAKSRLRRALHHVDDLALSFALDTIEAVRNSDRVQKIVVVTNDDRVRAALGHDIQVVDDPDAGLNAAVRAGLRAVGPGMAAVLTADLPGISPMDVTEALDAAGKHDRAMVADHSGLGTTLVSGPSENIVPSFGAGSRGRHERGGHAVLALPYAAAIRWDVDTPADLIRVLRTTPGDATSRVARAIGLDIEMGELQRQAS